MIPVKVNCMIVHKRYQQHIFNMFKKFRISNWLISLTIYIMLTLKWDPILYSASSCIMMLPYWQLLLETNRNTLINAN